MNAEKIDPNERAEILAKLEGHYGNKLPPGALDSLTNADLACWLHSREWNERERVLAYFIPIASGWPGYEHGSFLTSFAQAIIQADPDNFVMLTPAAFRLIVQYGLKAEEGK